MVVLLPWPVAPATIARCALQDREGPQEVQLRRRSTHSKIGPPEVWPASHVDGRVRPATGNLSGQMLERAHAYRGACPGGAYAPGLPRHTTS